jgi:anti-sigma regulatory factor (Ser/Thr protein kinase)
MAGAADDGTVLRIGVALADLARLYPWLEAEAASRAVPPALAQKMHVALEEAVMNVAMHAYGPGGDGEIAIRLLAAPDAATLLIEDTGPAFDPTAAVPRERAATLAETQVGGLGLTLLRHYCKDIAYERAGERNRLSLRFPISSVS